MIRLKTSEEIERLAAAGQVLAAILDEVEAYTRAGYSTEDLNDYALSRMEHYGAEPVLLGYHPQFAPHPYPAAICTSVNEVVQHGIPHPDEILYDGDIIDLDISIGYGGMIVDSARTYGVGTISDEAQQLIDVTYAARAAGIAAAVPGGYIGDIGAAIEAVVRPYGYGIVEVLCGHGVGYAVHEDPMVPNIGRRGEGERIEPGLVLAIEPIINLGSKEVVFDDEGDGYTVTSVDGSLSAHFEHTVAVTEGGPRVLTERTR